jgi:hypothetical protein
LPFYVWNHSLEQLTPPLLSHTSLRTLSHCSSRSSFRCLCSRSSLGRWPVPRLPLRPGEQACAKLALFVQPHDPSALPQESPTEDCLVCTGISSACRKAQSMAKVATAYSSGATSTLGVTVLLSLLICSLWKSLEVLGFSSLTCKTRLTFSRITATVVYEIR